MICIYHCSKTSMLVSIHRNSVFKAGVVSGVFQTSQDELSNEEMAVLLVVGGCLGYIFWDEIYHEIVS